MRPHSIFGRGETTEVKELITKVLERALDKIEATGMFSVLSVGDGEVWERYWHLLPNSACWTIEAAFVLASRGRSI